MNEQKNTYTLEWHNGSTRPIESGDYLCLFSSGFYMILPFSAKHRLWNAHDNSTYQGYTPEEIADHEEMVNNLVAWSPLPAPAEVRPDVFYRH